MSAFHYAALIRRLQHEFHSDPIMLAKLADADDHRTIMTAVAESWAEAVDGVRIARASRPGPVRRALLEAVERREDILCDFARHLDAGETARVLADVATTPEHRQRARTRVRASAPSPRTSRCGSAPAGRAALQARPRALGRATAPGTRRRRA